MNHSLFRIFLSIAFISFGILLFLSNLDVGEIGSSRLWGYIYSIFFIVIGLTLLIKFFFKRRSGWMLGSFFMIFGTLLLLGKVPSIDFSFSFSDIFKLWPLLIVYIGFNLIGLGKHRNAYRYRRRTKTKSKLFTIGDFHYKDPNWEVSPLYLKSAAGDYYFDFTKAFIPDGETPISVSSWAADLQMIIPENVAFRVDAYVKAGEIRILQQRVEGVNRHLTYQTANYSEAKKKLDIFLDLSAGSIRIDKA